MRKLRMVAVLVVLAATAWAPAETRAAEQGQVFCLDAAYNPEKGRSRQSLLVRELVRQAVLIAARDELGLATRDAALREPFPPGARVLDVDVTFEAGQLHAALLERSAGDERKVLWERIFPIPPPGHYYLAAPALVEASDALIRGDLVRTLKDAGFKGAANPAAGAEAAVPAGVEEWLGELNYFPQFAALRQLHAAMRAQGESPAVLGALTQAYANLGQLTQLQWNAAHQAFKARALLYAQRMNSTQPQNALWRRAYAWTMTGAHSEAIKDLARAGELGKGKNADAPAWVPLIDAACRYDTSFLLDAFSEDATAPTAPLASYLCFLTVENSGSIDALMRFAQAAQELNPACLRTIDAMTASGGVSAQHQTTLQAAELFKGAIFRDLPKIPDLPQDVSDVLVEAQKQANIPKSRADIAAAVVAAGDATRDVAEPSWAVLGRIMQDTFFAQTHRRVHFMAFTWGLDQQEVWDFAQLAKTLIGDHPYVPVLEAYGSWRDWEMAKALLSGVQFGDVNWSMYPLVVHVGSVPELRMGKLSFWQVMTANRDDTAADLERVVRAYAQDKNSSFKIEVARVLNEISPHSPVGIATLIEGDWERSQPKVADWERDYANHPAVAAAFARRYTQMERIDDAQRMWETALAVSPDIESYRALASLYLKKGDETQWLATMEKALTADDYGLGHAWVRVDVANHFMRKGDYQRALPYATEAAETWAGWAMWCASHCYEGLEDWTNAELWARRTAERYESQAAEWYVFCRRTGKGDERAALRLAKQYLARVGQAQSADDARYRGMLHLLAGDDRQAAKVLADGLARFNDPDCGMLAALLYDTAGDAANRDATWDALLKLRETIKKPDEWRRFFELVTLFKEQSAAPGPNDAATIEAHLGAAETPPKVFYWAGRFFRNRDNIEAAKLFYARCATSSPGLNRTLACAELRALGVEPRDLAPPTTNAAGSR